MASVTPLYRSASSTTLTLLAKFAKTVHCSSKITAFLRASPRWIRPKDRHRSLRFWCVIRGSLFLTGNAWLLVPPVSISWSMGLALNAIRDIRFLGDFVCRIPMMMALLSVIYRSLLREIAKITIILNKITKIIHLPIKTQKIMNIMQYATILVRHAHRILHIAWPALTALWLLTLCLGNASNFDRNTLCLYWLLEKYNKYMYLVRNRCGLCSIESWKTFWSDGGEQTTSLFCLLEGFSLE